MVTSSKLSLRGIIIPLLASVTVLSTACSQGTPELAVSQEAPEPAVITIPAASIEPAPKTAAEATVLPSPTNTPIPEPTATQITALDGRGGGTIVFTSHGNRGRELYAVNADGSGLRKITQTPVLEWHPAWSPDGLQILFAAENDEIEAEIFVMELKNGFTDPGEVAVVQLTDNIFPDENPSWSPDGEWIVFDSYRDGNRDIFIMAKDGSGLHWVTTHGDMDNNPAWSPDGNQIAFASNRDGDWEIFVTNVDGTGLQQLTDNEYSDRRPAWSPDGKFLAFDSTRDGNQDIYLLGIHDASNAETVQERRLTSNPSDDSEPTWSPDGSQILFSRNHTPDNTPGLYLVQVNGNGEHNLVIIEPGYASWKP